MNSKKKSIVISSAGAAIAAIALIVSSVYIPTMAVNASRSGSFSVMLTDPPTVPTGVTALYVNYSEVQVHVSDAGNQSGWLQLSGSGELNLMSLLNVSQTIASSTNVDAGVFNAVRFNITSASVTYDGQNYTADLVYQEHTITVPIIGGISVSSAETSVALIDLSPTVILLGTPQDPTFALLPSASAFVVPSSSIPAESHHIGARHYLDRDSWWMNQASKESAFGVTSVSLSPSRVSITVVNTGQASSIFRIAAVTSQTSLSGGWQSILSTSDLFVVEPNETLAILSGSTRAQMYQEIVAGGYLLAPGQSATFTYSSNAPITIGQQMLDLGQQIQTQLVTPGLNYQVDLVGNGLVSQAGTVATA